MQFESGKSELTATTTISPSAFSGRFMRLIFYAWAIPPVIGLSFLVWIHMFTPAQILDILLSPTESLFILGNLTFALWFFRRYAIVIRDFLQAPDDSGRHKVSQIIQRFPLAFWTVFLAFLAMAPTSVILSAEWFTDFRAQPADWFQIHLVAVIVSIVVGLPIFYLIFDLFGIVAGKISLEKPVLTIRTKVFLIGSLIPLLIDTLLVLYFWTRTGFFTFETFGLWLALELIAIYGTLIFVRSFGQSLRPFREFVEPSQADNLRDPGELVQLSTDELGVLVSRFRRMLERERLLEGQLLHAQKLEAVGRLAGGVAHDFNNDLMVILGNAELLRERLAEDDPQLQFVDAIIETTNRSAAIARSLLTFSRRRDLKVEPVDMNTVVRDFGTLLERLMGNAIDIKTKYCGQRATAPVDRGQIEQALMNLSLNARDAMPNGGTLTLATRRIKDDNDNESHILITVSDTGKGIEPSVQQNIFEPFFTTKKEGAGTGLGLSMVHGVLAAHGGSIDFESTPGLGTSFYIRLPMTEATTQAQPAEETLDHRGSQTVLLAEDNQSVRDLLVTQFESSGYSVVSAADGIEALRQFHEHEAEIDVAVLDFQMPNKNGWEVSEEIHCRKPGLPVVLITGNAQDMADVDLGDSKTSVFQKPFSSNSLMGHIRQVVEG